MSTDPSCANGFCPFLFTLLSNEYDEALLLLDEGVNINVRFDSNGEHHDPFSILHIKKSKIEEKIKEEQDKLTELKNGKSLDTYSFFGKDRQEESSQSYINFLKNYLDKIQLIEDRMLSAKENDTSPTSMKI